MKGSYYNTMELKQLNIIQSVIDKKRTGKEAANILKITERQVWRKVKSVKENGEIGIKHKNQFHKPKHTISDDLKKKIINLKLSYNYCDTNFSHFRELFEEKEKNMKAIWHKQTVPHLISLKHAICFLYMDLLMMLQAKF
jgi:hypothetical protein